MHVVTVPETAIYIVHVDQNKEFFTCVFFFFFFQETTERLLGFSETTLYSISWYDKSIMLLLYVVLKFLLP